MRKLTIQCRMLLNDNTKSRSFKELEKKLDREIKQVLEDSIKEKLDKKIDYDTMSLTLEVFNESKFRWRPEHFEAFDSSPEEFRGRKLTKSIRECFRLGIRLAATRDKISFILRNNQVIEKQRNEIDDLTWNFAYYS